MLQVELDSEVLTASLQKAKQQLSNMRPVMAAIGAAIEQNVQLRFDSKTAPDGTPWKPWAAKTAMARSKEGRGTLLEYTGRMRDSLTYVADNDSVAIGFGVPYASFHEFGTGDIPARPMLLDNGQLSADDTADALSAAERALDRLLKD